MTVMIDTTKWTRLREVDAYAAERGISRDEAVERLVNQALSDGPNPQHAMLLQYAHLHGVSQDEAYIALWGVPDDDDDDSDFEDKTADRIVAHEMWLASEGADHLFEGHGE